MNGVEKSFTENLAPGKASSRGLWIPVDMQALMKSIAAPRISATTDATSGRAGEAPTLPAEIEKALGGMLVFESSYGGLHDSGAAGIAYDLDAGRSVQRTQELHDLLRKDSSRQGCRAVLGQHRGRMIGHSGEGYAVLTHSTRSSMPSIPTAEVEAQLERLARHLKARSQAAVIMHMPELEAAMITKGMDPQALWERFAESLGWAAARTRFIRSECSWGKR